MTRNQTSSTIPPASSRSGLREYGDALKAHLYNAKLIVYSLLLVVGVTQIIIREHFPELHPPWPVIGGLLIGILLGIVFLPPLLVVRRRRKPRTISNLRQN